MWPASYGSAQYWGASSGPLDQYTGSLVAYQPPQSSSYSSYAQPAFPSYNSYTSPYGYPSFGTSGYGYGFPFAGDFATYAPPPEVASYKSPAETYTPQQVGQRPAPQASTGANNNTKMVVVTGSAQATPTAADRVVQAVRQLCDGTRRESGCVEYSWTQSLEDPNTFIILELWENEEALQQHLASDHVNAFKEVVSELFVEDPNVQKGTVTSWEEI
eukprot:TRINITY_DN4860_c0_g1_i1.p1 TRINITY_DN4860_c0_g1~~TRINITY_DN4860_c0_g1_i1.p1  ORF type:complete len:216 (+),score=26.25 TRINITY_DN4860_c0_g1_i1:37-684(+)